MKKLISIILSIVMLLSITTGLNFSAYALEASGKCGNNATYTFDSESGLLTISGTGDISDERFYGYGEIKSVIINNGITSIGEDAFNKCNSLTSIKIPNSVTSIGYDTFSSCDSLTSITVDNANPNFSSQDGVLFNKDKTTLIQYPVGNSRTQYAIPNSVTSIGWDAFSYCNSLTSIEIPNSVTSIGRSAFFSCDSLTSIEIPNSVTSIGGFAFAFCNILTSIEIPNSVTSIGEDAFAYCRRLTSIEIPNSVTSIGIAAFISCSSLTSITVDNANPNYSSQDGILFNKNKTKLIQYPIGNSRTQYTIPNSVTSIVSSAFYKCNSLTSIEIPNSVTSISYDAFDDCNSLKDVYYTGSEAEWKKIDVGGVNNRLLNATIHFSYVSPDTPPVTPTINETIYISGENIKLSDVIGNQTFANYVKSVNSTQYAPKLSYLLAGLSRSVYNESNIKKSYESLGFKSPKVSNYDGSDTIPGHIIGKQTLSDGSVMVLVTIRGSYNLGNWLTNINFDKNPLAYGNHAGFNSAANAVYANLKSYMGGSLPTSNVRYVITGHSLGGATANLLAKKLADNEVPQANIYDYNFACPDTVRRKSSDANNDKNNFIFNIGSAKDYVSVVPGITVGGMTGTIYQWGKYGKSYWFSKDWNNVAETNIDFLKTIANHDAVNYVDYMAKLKPLSAFKTWKQMTSARGTSVLKTIIHAIFCPVDVDVYNENGKLVASVKNNEVVKCDVDSGVLVFVEDDHKYVSVPENKNYRIDLTGTDKGSMTYTVTKTDINTDTVEETKTFSNVALTKGKTMSTESVANAAVTNTKLYVVNDKKERVAEISQTGKETAAKTTESKPAETKPEAKKKTAKKVSLKLKKVTVKKSAKKLVLQATLKINGKAAKGKKVTFKFNGKKYTAKTNKKGVAKVTIKKSVLKKLKKGKKVTYSVTYGKKTVKRTVKVKK